MKLKTEEEEKGYLETLIPKPPGKLEGLKIVKKIGDDVNRTRKNAYKTANLAAGYLEGLGGKELIQRSNPNSELGRILFG